MTDTTDPANVRMDLSPDLVRRAHLCASTEKTRDYLNGVRVEPNTDGGATLIATDGHKLVAIRDASAVLEHMPSGQGLAAQGVTIALTKDTLRALNSAKAARLIIENNTATVYATDASKLHIQTVTPWCESQGYPDWRRVLPGNDANATHNAIFDQNVLDVLAEALSVTDSRRKQRPLKILTRDEASPALVFGSLQDAFGVAMPMRFTDDRTAKPSWVNS